MKKQIIKATALTLIVTSLVFSCKKKDETTPDESVNVTTTGGTTTVATGSFQWQENGGAIINADSAFWTTYGTAPNGGTGVRAYKGGMTNFFEINWLIANNTSVGTKTLDPTYGVTFIKSNVTYTGTSSQVLSITASSSTSISGIFSTPVSGGTITTLTGTFSSINKK